MADESARDMSADAVNNGKDCRRKESSLSLTVDLIAIIVRRSGAMSVKPC